MVPPEPIKYVEFNPGNVACAVFLSVDNLKPGDELLYISEVRLVLDKFVVV